MKKINLTPKQQLLLVCVFGGMLSMVILPWVVEQAWNGFFVVVFGAPHFDFWNAVALIFWLLALVGVVWAVVLPLKEVKE